MKCENCHKKGHPKEKSFRLHPELKSGGHNNSKQEWLKGTVHKLSHDRPELPVYIDDKLVILILDTGEQTLSSVFKLY